MVGAALLFGGQILQVGLSLREKLLDERYETVLHGKMLSAVSSIKELMLSISTAVKFLNMEHFVCMSRMRQDVPVGIGFEPQREGRKMGLVESTTISPM